MLYRMMIDDPIVKMHGDRTNLPTAAKRKFPGTSRIGRCANFVNWMPRPRSKACVIRP